MTEYLDGELIAWHAGHQTERDVELIGLDHAQQVGGDASRSPISTPGWAVPKRASRPDTSTAPAGMERPDPDLPVHHAAQVVDVGAGAVDLGEDAARAGGDGQARRRWG